MRKPKVALFVRYRDSQVNQIRTNPAYSEVTTARLLATYPSTGFKVPRAMGHLYLGKSNHQSGECAMNQSS
jgi:hypothetical protein